MTTVTLGKVALKVRGLFSDSTSYNVGDIVDYSGQAFICIKNRPGSTTNEIYRTRPLIYPHVENSAGTQSLDYPGSEVKSRPNASSALGIGHTTWTIGTNALTSISAGAASNGIMVNTEYWEKFGGGLNGYNVWEASPWYSYGGNNSDFWLNGNNYSNTRNGSLHWIGGGIWLYTGKNALGEFYDHPYENFYGNWRCIHNGDIIPRERAIAALDGAGPPSWSGHPNPSVTKPTWGNNSYRWQGNVPRNIPTDAKRSEYNWRSTGNHAYGNMNSFITWDGNTPAMNGHNGQNELGPWTHEGGFRGGYKASTQKDFWDAYTIDTSTYGWGKDYKDKRKKSKTTYAGYTSLDDYGTISLHNSLVGDNSQWAARSGSSEYEFSPARHSSQYADYLLDPYGSKPRPVQIEWWTHESMATLMSDGSIYMIGYNGYHAYGTDHGNNYPYGSHLGRDVFGGKRIVKIAGSGWNGQNGAGHGIALDEDGEIWTWGYNGYGQCGGTNPTGASQGTYGGYYNGVHENFRNPTKLPKDVFFEGQTICDIWCWGGQYGINFVLDSNGYLWSWGYNGNGALGYPTNSGYANTDRSQNPVKLNINWSSYAGIQKLTCGGMEANSYVVVLDGQGQLWSCGYNGYANLGDGTTTSTGNAGSLTRRTGLNIAGSITNVWCTGGQKFITWMRHSNGNLYGMGRSSAYDLTSNTSNQTAPVLQNNVSNPYKIVYAGRENGVTTACLTGSWDVYAVGWNGYGEAGYGHTGNPNDNQNRQQPSGSARWGWARMAMPSSLTRQIRDIQGRGYYDSTLSHINLFQMKTAEGEVLTTGRGYWWGTGLSNNHHYHPMAHGLWGS